MNKKVLVIAGSPRKGGNSDLLCEEVIRGAQASGNTAEKVYLQDLRIGPCRACYSCRGNGVCVQKDDEAELLEKMISADVIVLATPVYFYSMDSQMKAMIDRTLPRYTEIRSKEFIFIATAAAGIPKGRGHGNQSGKRSFPCRTIHLRNGGSSGT